MLDVHSKAPETQAEAPALKADDLGSSAMGAAMSQHLPAEAGPGAGPATAAAPVRRKAGDAASEGFRGPAQEVPYRAEMEQSFGADFGGVQAYTNPRAAAASRELGAHAYAVGNQVAFNSPSPDKATVAHELTHVMQHGGGAVQRKAGDGGGRGAEIDTSGEGEAEKVEAAVAAGKPARSALEGGVAKQGGPRLKAGRGIARKEAGGGETGTPFTLGMTFSPEGLEKQYFWNLWKSPPFEVPIPAVPGLMFRVQPQVQLVASGGLNWHEKQLETELKLLGVVGMGLAYGKSELAEVYAVMEGNVDGGFQYAYKYEHEAAGAEAGHAEGAHAAHPETAQQEHAHHEPAHAAAPAKKEAKSWELSGAIGLSTNFAVGVELAGGWVDYRFEFGHCDIGKLTGLSWKDGAFDRSAIGWEWGEKPKEFFASLKHVVEKAEKLKKAGADAFQHGMQKAKQGAQSVYNTGRAVMQWATSW